jgi:hypothetical protein
MKDYWKILSRISVLPNLGEYECVICGLRRCLKPFEMEVYGLSGHISTNNELDLSLGLLPEALFRVKN